MLLLAISINRNIVECKEAFFLSILNCNQVLIETLWNVKSPLWMVEADFWVVLIETLWNVKKDVFGGILLWVPY